MPLTDYTGLITIGSTDIVDAVSSTITANAKVKASSLENDLGFCKASDKANTVTTADKAKQLSKASGVSAGTYGPNSNVTIDSGTNSINIPQITVTSNGLVTSAKQFVLKVSTY